MQALLIKILEDGIQAVRRILPNCWFNKDKTRAGVECLQNYRRVFNEKTSSFQNRPLHDWSSHAVTDMSTMFLRATNFNQNLSSLVANVTDMSGMFSDASKFNQEIRSWSIQNGDILTNMFLNTTKMIETYSALLGWGTTPLYTYFNLGILQANIQHIINSWILDPVAVTTTYGHISAWDTGLITDMSQLFKDMSGFNNDISSWNTSSVTNMSQMFYNASGFNQNIGNWDVSM